MTSTASQANMPARGRHEQSDASAQTMARTVPPRAHHVRPGYPVCLFPCHFNRLGSSSSAPAAGGNSRSTRGTLRAALGQRPGTSTRGVATVCEHMPESAHAGGVLIQLSESACSPRSAAILSPNEGAQPNEGSQKGSISFDAHAWLSCLMSGRMRIGGPRWRRLGTGVPTVALTQRSRSIMSSRWQTRHAREPSRAISLRRAARATTASRTCRLPNGGLAWLSTSSPCAQRLRSHESWVHRLREGP